MKKVNNNNKQINRLKDKIILFFFLLMHQE